MTIDVQEFIKLSKKAGELKTEAERATGALEQLMKKLEKEFGCDSVEEAEKLIEKTEKELNDTEKEYKKALGEFKEKWKGQL